MHGGARWESTRHTTVHSRLRGAERTLSPSARLAAALRLPGGRPTVMTDAARFWWQKFLREFATNGGGGGFKAATLFPRGRAFASMIRRSEQAVWVRAAPLNA
jgi:hypothetical protein